MLYKFATSLLRIKPMQMKTLPPNSFIHCTLLLFLLSTIPIGTANATTYGPDATDNISQWSIKDNNPSGASVNSVYDESLQQEVTETHSSGTLNAFVLGDISSSKGWNNTEEFNLSWAMQSLENYNILVRIDTTEGWRYLKYNQAGKDYLANGNGRSIHYGLNASSKSQHWQTFSRNLTEDLQKAQPNNTILAVNGFIVSGNVRIANVALTEQTAPTLALSNLYSIVGLDKTFSLNSTIQGEHPIASYEWLNNTGEVIGTEPTWQGSTDTLGLHHYQLRVTDNNQLQAVATTTLEAVDDATPSVYSDAESVDENAWQPSSSSSTIAIDNVLDPDNSNNRVIQLSANGLTNQDEALIGGKTLALSGWNNQTQHHLRLKAKAEERFRVYVLTQTDQGSVTLWYDNRDVNALANTSGRLVHHGLGTLATDNQWHSHDRDLAADLADAYPDRILIAVHGILFRGSAYVDDVTLSAETLPEVIEYTQPTTPENLSPAVAAQIEQGARTAFTWGTNEHTSHYDFHLFNRVDGSVIIVSNLNPEQYCTADQCTLNMPVELPVHASHAWRVRSHDSRSGLISEWSRSEFDVITEISQKPAMPINTSPSLAANLESGSDVTFTWQVSETADSYDFHFFNRLDASVIVTSDLVAETICNDQTCQYTASIAELPVHNEHAWRVRAHNRLGYSEWSRSTFNIIGQVTEAPAMPENSQPVAGVTLVSGSTVTFEWQASDNADTYDFHFFDNLSKDTSVVSDLSAEAICSNQVCSYTTVVNLPEAKDHAWRVRASNIRGYSEWSRSVFSVIAAATEAPEEPVNLTPEVNANLQSDTNHTFTWSAISNAHSYEFHIFDATTGEVQPIITGLLPEQLCDAQTCSFNTLVSIPESRLHAWRVRAQNNVGYSSWSRSIFSTEALELPSTPNNLTPVAEASVLANTEQTFTWEAVAVAETYEFHIFNGVTASVDPVVTDLQPSSICSNGICQYSRTVDLPASEQHAWRVRAVNSSGSSSWSRSLLTVTEPAEPEDPLNLTPELNATIANGTTQAFTWASVATADSYEFHLFNGVTGNVQPVIEDLQSEDYCDSEHCTLETLVDLPESALHAWRVRAKNTLGYSEWSRSLFTVTDGDSPSTTELVASFSASKLTGTAPVEVNVDASASTDPDGIILYEWTFGDEEPISGSTLTQTSHVFTEPGTYTISLTVTNAAEQSASQSETVVVVAAPTGSGNAEAEEAARLLTQATFGSTREDIATVQSIGLEPWIDQQFTLKGSAHLDYVQQYSNGSLRGPRHEVWWQDVVEGDDQLRQRVAYALSQLFVVSDTGFTLSNAQYAITHYYDQLRDHAFGNYRDLLETVTLSPVMGIYLSMLQNDKANPETNTRADENYAREVLQLFSIGLYELNVDGSQTGNKSFTQENVEAFARVFTGWNYTGTSRWDQPLFTGQDMISPMSPFEDHHDTGSKTLLNNQVAAAGLSARADLEFALDNIFNHRNVGPFVSGHLIRHLVTSNPSPEYIARVATVFNNNGQGVRGDLQAVVKAILMDDEARNGYTTANFGKLREPNIRLANLWRAFSITRGNQSAHGEFNTYTPSLDNLEVVTGQAVLRANSVFNFFQAEHTPAGPVMSLGLKSPEFQIMTDGNLLATTSRINNQIHRHYKSNPYTIELNPSYLDFSYEMGLASDPDALLDHLNLLLMSGQMSDDLRDILASHIASLPDSAEGLGQRVRDVVSLIMASPEYLVQK